MVYLLALLIAIILADRKRMAEIDNLSDTTS